MSSPFEVRYLLSHGRARVIGILRNMCHVITDVTANHRQSLRTVRVLPVRQFAKYPHPQAAAAMGVRTCWLWETAATLPSAQPREAFLQHWGEEKSVGCISWRLPAYSLFILTASMGRIVCGARCPWGETPMRRNVNGAKYLPW